MSTIGMDDYRAALERARQPYQARYDAMYSSLLDGIVTDPVLMQVPVDDHLVHRGDGVFETVKCEAGALYNLDGHLERLGRSAAALDLALPDGLAGVREASLATARAGGRRDCLVRILVSRGPGGFSVDPFESVGPQLYVIAYALPAPFMERHPDGAAVIRSSIPVKAPFFAGVKSCNYLANVLMKREAVLAGADIAAGFDAQGRLAEGATENIGIVSAEGQLLFPRPDGILKGTTMYRVLELAQELVADGLLSAAGMADIGPDAIAAAREILLVGTTTDVAPVSRFDGRAVPGPVPGPVARGLNDRLRDDILHNSAMRTPVFEDPSERSCHA